MRQKFVQWRVKEPYCNRQVLHLLKYADEVALLHWKELGKRIFSPICIISKYHLPHSLYPVSFKKHMLCPAKTNAFCAKISCNTGIIRCICICPYTNHAYIIHPCH